jgi:hypothetical protein
MAENDNKGVIIALGGATALAALLLLKKKPVDPDVVSEISSLSARVV